LKEENALSLDLPKMDKEGERKKKAMSCFEGGNLWRFNYFSDYIVLWV
jgi:hypothetical protein